jgi:endonuclease/exonuclease/phosphatase family metal-dependent hydrolase
MRLLSYNIHKGIGGRDRLYRLDRIVEVIRHEKPDVVCLQEVDRNVKRSNFDDQPALLAKALEFEHSTYQFNHRVAGGGYGNLVLSHGQIHNRHNLSLRFKTRKNRRAQVVVVDTASGPLRLVNWHLGLADRERHWQVETLLGHASFCAYSDMPTLIAGDFNDWRDTLHRGALSQACLTQITTPASRFRSFPAYMPVGSLDKAFCCGRVKVEKAHVVKSALTRKASDHLPLVVDFQMT